MSDPTQLADGLRDAAAAAGGTASVGGVLFWLFKRWVDRVDARLDSLAAKVDTMIVGHAVNQGMVETVRRTADQATTTVGVLDKTVTKIWATLEAKGVIGRQPSDCD